MSERISVGTSRALCRHVAERWHNHYGDNPHNPKHAEITVALRALNKNGTRAEIDRIIGNDTWTTRTCDVCRRQVESWVIFGDDAWESTTNVCAECLDDAAAELAVAV